MASRTPQDLQHDLRGVFGFPVTPFTRNGELDEESLRLHVRWMLRSDLSAIFPCAGTGEFFSLELEEYAAAVRAVVEEVGGRLPVVAGAGYSTRIACRFACAAEAAGADGLLVLPPYLVQAQQEGLYRHYAEIAESTGIGILLYQRDNAVFSPATVRRLAERRNVIGFKDGHGNLELLQRIQLELGDRLAWMNGMPTAELTFPSYHATGVNGYSSALSNFFPHITLRFHQAVVNGDRSTTEELLREVVEPLARVRDRGKGYAVAYVKAAMNLLELPAGRSAGPVRPPLVDLDPASLDELRKVLERASQRYPA